MKAKQIDDFTTGVLAVVNGVLRDSDYQKDVLDIQVDASLDPGTPAEGDRYIISAPGALNANFGTINKLYDGTNATLGTGDIVEYVSGEFRIAFDVSAKGDGTLCMNQATNRFYELRDTTWHQMGIDFQPFFSTASETVNTSGTVSANTDFEVTLSHSKKTGYWYVVAIENYMCSKSQIKTPSAADKIKLNVPFEVLATENIDVYYFY